MWFVLCARTSLLIGSSNAKKLVVVKLSLIDCWIMKRNSLKNNLHMKNKDKVNCYS